jgi:hypothetical protein
LHFKREDRKKKAKQMESAMSEANGGEENEMSIIETFNQDLRDKETKERIYPKNVTVEEMANQEWENLLQLAAAR